MYKHGHEGTKWLQHFKMKYATMQEHKYVWYFLVFMLGCRKIFRVGFWIFIYFRAFQDCLYHRCRDKDYWSYYSSVSTIYTYSICHYLPPQKEKKSKGKIQQFHVVTLPFDATWALASPTEGVIATCRASELRSAATCSLVMDFFMKGSKFCSWRNTPVTYTVTVAVVAIFLWAGRLHRSVECTCKLHLLTAMQRRQQLLLECLFLFLSKKGALSIIYDFHLVAVQSKKC